MIVAMSQQKGVLLNIKQVRLLICGISTGHHNYGFSLGRLILYDPCSELSPTGFYCPAFNEETSLILLHMMRSLENPKEARKRIPLTRMIIAPEGMLSS